MKFSRHISKLIFASLVIATSAHAQMVTALKINSDYFPSTVYEVGFDINPVTSLIDRVYFNESKMEPVFFTLDELQHDYAVVFKRWGFEFVRMKVVKMDSATSGLIELSVLRSVISKTRDSFLFDVRLNAGTNSYEIVDRRNGHVFKTAVVKTNFKAFMPIGIRDIQTK